MVKVNLGDQTFPLPESWDDVISSGRYLDVVAILAIAPAAPDSLEIRYYIYEKMLFLYSDGALEKTNIPPTLIPAASMQLIDECYPILKFIFDTQCTSCPIPSIRHRGFTYTAKGQYMLPMTGEEMEECAHSYAEYQKTGDIAFLDKIISTLYRPKWKALRHLLSDDRLASLPPMVKLGIKFWYENCEAWWYARYSHLYKSSHTPGAAHLDSLTVSRLIRGLAGPKRGTVEQVRLMNRDEIYFELSELDREREDAEHAASR